MERGVTHDPEFEAWANKVWNFGNAQAAAEQREKEVSLKDFRRNLTIDVFNEAGQKVISYKVYRAWVSEFTAQADLDANANAILIQSIKIEHEGWERDGSVTEPAEPLLGGGVVPGEPPDGGAGIGVRNDPRRGGGGGGGPSPGVSCRERGPGRGAGRASALNPPNQPNASGRRSCLPAVCRPVRRQAVSTT